MRAVGRGYAGMAEWKLPKYPASGCALADPDVTVMDSEDDKVLAPTPAPTTTSRSRFKCGSDSSLALGSAQEKCSGYLSGRPIRHGQLELDPVKYRDEGDVRFI